MKVSILIAAYNIEDYIERCLDSVINQTLREIEIIVVNDGSSDDTRLKIEKLKEQDERIVLINQENKGLIETRKTGLENAKGEYILFLDGDDWLELNSAELLYKSAKQNTSDVVIYNGKQVYDSGEILEFNGFDIANEASIKEDALKALLMGGVNPGIVLKFLNRKFLKENNIEFPNNISYAEDLATSSVIFANKPKISFVKDELYNYYMRSNSLTNQIDEKFLELYEALNFIKGTIIKYDVFEAYKDEYEYLFFRHGFFNLKKVHGNNELHKKAYDLYMKENLVLNQNMYISEFKNRNIFNKILVLGYYKNHNLGKFYYKHIYLNLIEVKNKLKK